MTNIIDRPTTGTLPPVIPDIEVPTPEPPETKTPRIFRWLGWLLLVGAIAAVTFFLIDANSDDGVPPVAVNVDPGAITADPTAPGAITADPKTRTPVAGLATDPQTVEDTTVSPLVYSDSRPALADWSPPEMTVAEGMAHAVQAAVGSGALPEMSVAEGMAAAAAGQETTTAFPEESTVSPSLYWP